MEHTDKYTGLYIIVPEKRQVTYSYKSVLFIFFYMQVLILDNNCSLTTNDVMAMVDLIYQYFTQSTCFPQ